MSGAARDSPLRVVVVHPDLLGTYGDGGNGIVLTRRAAWRGIGAELVQAPSGRPVPAGDVYCLGGGEDGPQVRSAEALVAEGTIGRAVADGAVVLGVCAGYQLLGRSFPDAHDRPVEGLGLLDLTTRKGTGPRAVGELVGAYAPGAPVARTAGRLSGFENHGGVTTLGPDAEPLAVVVSGVGNGPAGDGAPATEGAWRHGVVGTYLHGPVLARNPALADLLLSWALGTPPEGPDALAALDDREEDRLRAERLAAAAAAHPPRPARR